MPSGAADLAARFELAEPGQAILRLDIGATGADWSSVDAACTVVEIRVDDDRPIHLIVPTAECVARSIHLGRLAAGRHTLALALGRGSAEHIRTFDLASARVDLVPDGDPRATVLRHAPILFGRTTRHLGSPWQNTLTDAPLIGWHTEDVGPSGNRRIEFSILWSHEDEGTSAPALMARWGRSTDIEWVYRVDVDARGDRIPGTASFQGPNHRVLPFHGAFQDDRPLLQTATGNNMVTDRIGDSPLRFSPAPDLRLGRRWSRESVMRRNDWTYGVMRAELEREGRIGDGRDRVDDPRRFLYLEAMLVRGSRGDLDSHPGVAFCVRLAGHSTVFRSDRGDEELAVDRVGPVSSSVGLPPGTTCDDILDISMVAHRSGPGIATVGAVGLRHAFTLDERLRPSHRIITRGLLSSPSAVQPTGTLLWRRDTATMGRRIA